MLYTNLEVGKIYYSTESYHRGAIKLQAPSIDIPTETYMTDEAIEKLEREHKLIDHSALILNHQGPIDGIHVAVSKGDSLLGTNHIHFREIILDIYHEVLESAAELINQARSDYISHPTKDEAAKFFLETSICRN